jgi:hypothetical protein
VPVVDRKGTCFPVDQYQTRRPRKVTLPVRVSTANGPGDRSTAVRPVRMLRKMILVGPASSKWRTLVAT